MLLILKKWKKTEEKNVNITVPTNKKRLIQDKDKMFPRAYVSLGFSLFNFRFLNVLSKECLGNLYRIIFCL